MLCSHGSGVECCAFYVRSRARKKSRQTGKALVKGYLESDEYNDNCRIKGESRTGSKKIDESEESTEGISSSLNGIAWDQVAIETLPFGPKEQIMSLFESSMSPEVISDRRRWRWTILMFQKERHNAFFFYHWECISLVVPFSHCFFPSLLIMHCTYYAEVDETMCPPISNYSFDSVYVQTKWEKASWFVYIVEIRTESEKR